MTGSERSRAARATSVGGRRGQLASLHADADQNPGLLLWQVTNRWQAAQRAALKPFELTHVQFVLLASLAWLDDGSPVTQKQLALHAATDEMMTSQVLRALEDRGLVRRGRHPSDARARALSVTTTGAALAHQANVVVEDCDAYFFAPLHSGTGRFVRDLHTLRQRPTR